MHVRPQAVGAFHRPPAILNNTEGSMPHFNNGKEVKVGDAVRLDGRTGVVSRVSSSAAGNEQPVVVEIQVRAVELERI